MRQSALKFKAAYNNVIEFHSEKGEKSLLLGLAALVDFLNQRYDHEGKPVGSRNGHLAWLLYLSIIKPQQQQVLATTFSRFESGDDVDIFEFHMEAKAVRDEIAALLTPIIDKDGYRLVHLELLLERIAENRPQLPMLTLNPKACERDEVLARLQLAEFNGWDLELPGGEIVRVSESWSYLHAFSFRSLVYGLLAQIVKDNSLWRMAICPHCKNFFCKPSRIKFKYCSENCRDEANNRRKPA